MVELCGLHSHKVFNLIQTLKTKIHESRFAEQRLVALFQYCCLVDHLAEFLLRKLFGPKSKKETLQNIKTLLIRDTTHFLCNALLNLQHSDPKFLRANIEYLYSFCRKILPSCAENFESSLNFVVSTLVALVVGALDEAEARNESVDTAMKCLRFLVIEMSDHFDKEIALLDTFPGNVIFLELRTHHKDIKYKSHQYGLTEELDCFLQVESRKADGLAALREQV